MYHNKIKSLTIQFHYTMLKKNKQVLQKYLNKNVYILKGNKKESCFLNRILFLIR